MPYVNCKGGKLRVAGVDYGFGEVVPVVALTPGRLSALVAARRIAWTDESGAVAVPPPVPRAVSLPAKQVRGAKV
jgi:hypothetical protein